jgi:tyrosinase
MRTSIFVATLATAASALALPQNLLEKSDAPALPLNVFADIPKLVVPLTLEELRAMFKNETEPPVPEFKIEGDMSTQATCGNVRVRQEWDSYSDSDRRAFTDSIRCLMTRPASGQFGASRSRYEDLVALHQTLTPNVHNNAKFLIWHRYYLWTFESLLRSECGFDRALPWFDETRYSGRFAQSSIFNSQNFGSINVGGRCVTDGQFANLAINIGPGTENTYHCLARNNDDSKTANTNSGVVDECNNLSSYSSMARCAEIGAHGWGHNGIGAVMEDPWASPADPIFWLHHAFIDRNFRIWQNKDSNRVRTIDGTDAAGNQLTLDTTVNVYDFRPTVRIRDILDTTGETLCYKYNY